MSARRLVSRAAVVSLAGLVAACSSGVDLAVDVRTDLVAGQEFDAVEVALDERETDTPAVTAGDDFTRPRRVAELTGVEAGRHTVRVALLRSGETVVSRRVALRLEGSQIVLVVLTRDCRGVMCPGSGDDAGESECLGGRCVDPECGALGDGEGCGDAECESDAECASTVACVEARCVSGVCLDLPGEGACSASDYCQPDVGCLPRPISTDGGVRDGGGTCGSDAECDDGIACTRDRCATGLCESGPDDALCGSAICDPGSRLADPVTGCTTTACSPETCVASGCETATCVAGRCERASTCADAETCCGAVCALDCTTAVCAGQPAGTLCRAASGGCDVEERCDGSSPTCPADAVAPPGTECRAATGTCDVAESCTGSSAACPIDAFAPVGTGCAGGSCNGLGTCSSGCTPGAACSTGNPCERGQLDCSSGSPVCVSAGPASSGILCRASAGPCDAEERCSGASTACPGDAFLAPSTSCRASTGVCDVPELCTGTGPSCPADQLASPALVCRSSAGPCDVAESCTGSGGGCPGDAFLPASTTCRASAGPCDAVELCTGSGAGCPADAYQPASVVCRPARDGCDVAETCRGTSTTCPIDAFAAPTTVCRASLGVCDPAETCTSGVCPADSRSPGGTICRPVLHPSCDIAEECDGSSPACPPNGVINEGGTCSDATFCGGTCTFGFCENGTICDVDEVCTCGGTQCLASGENCI